MATLRTKKKPGEQEIAAAPVPVTHNAQVTGVGIASDTTKTPLVSTTAENYARRMVPNNPLTGQPQFTGQPGQYATLPSGDIVSQQQYNTLLASVRPQQGTNIAPTIPQQPPTAPLPTQPAPPVQQPNVAPLFQPQLGQPTQPQSKDQATIEREAITAVNAGNATPGQQNLYNKISGGTEQITSDDLANAVTLALPIKGGMITEGLKGAEALAVKKLTQQEYGAIKDIAQQTAKETYTKFTENIAKEGAEVLTSNPAITESGIKAMGGKVVTTAGKTINEGVEKVQGNFMKKIIEQYGGTIKKYLIGGLIGGYIFGVTMAFNKTGDKAQQMSMILSEAKKQGDLETAKEIRDDLQRLHSVNQVLKNFIPYYGYFSSELTAWQTSLDYADAVVKGIEKEQAKAITTPQTPAYQELQTQLLNEQLIKAQRENQQATARVTEQPNPFG